MCRISANSSSCELDKNGAAPFHLTFQPINIMSKTHRKDYYEECSKGGFGKPWHIQGDKKRWYKPGKKFKKLQKKSRKAKEKEAIRLDKEVIPEFPKTNTWNWN